METPTIRTLIGSLLIPLCAVTDLACLAPADELESATGALSQSVTGFGSSVCEPGSYSASRAAEASFMQNWIAKGCRDFPDFPPMSCFSYADCPNGGHNWFCSMTGQCEAGCQSDWNCPSSQICLFGSCVNMPAGEGGGGGGGSSGREPVFCGGRYCLSGECCDPTNQCSSICGLGG